MRHGMLLCLACLPLLGCGARPAGTGPQEVRVAAAADLKFAFEDVARAFEKAHPDVRVKATYGSSGNFFAQLSERAPFDLFLSANVEYPRRLAEKGLGDSRFVYAIGHLVVWVPRASPLDVEKQGVQALLDPAVKKVAIANPRHAPYGRAAEAALKKLGVYDKLKDRLVLGENIAQTAQLAETGAADAGVLAHSLVMAPALRDKGRYWPVPLDAHPRLEQGGIVLEWAQDRKAPRPARLPDRRRGAGRPEAFRVPLARGVTVDAAAVLVTLKLALCTTGVLLVIGLPLGWWLATTRWRGRFLVEAVVALPLVLPPTVLGFYVLLATGPNGPLGAGWLALTGERLAFSFPGILAGSVLFNLPFAVRPFAAAFAGVDRRLVEASWCLGASRLATFFRVVLPLSWPGVLAGLVLTFAHSVGEFGVVLMVGGNIPGVTRTLSIALYDDVQALDYASAGRTALALVAFSFVVLCLTHALVRRGPLP
jgi:molybdate transport system permease protein